MHSCLFVPQLSAPVSRSTFLISCRISGLRVPRRPGVDNDGLSDGDEVNVYQTDPEEGDTAQGASSPTRGELGLPSVPLLRVNTRPALPPQKLASQGKFVFYEFSHCLFALSKSVLRHTVICLMGSWPPIHSISPFFQTRPTFLFNSQEICPSILNNDCESQIHTAGKATAAFLPLFFLVFKTTTRVSAFAFYSDRLVPESISTPPCRPQGGIVLLVTPRQGTPRESLASRASKGLRPVSGSPGGGPLSWTTTGSRMVRRSTSSRPTLGTATPDGPHFGGKVFTGALFWIFSPSANL